MISVKKKAAFSLVEIILAMVILSVTMAATTNLFLSAKRYSRHSHCRLQAGNLGRQLLDNLQMEIRQDQWSGNDYLASNLLRKGTRPLGDEYLWAPSIRYQPTYVISVPPGFNPATSPMRKVKLVLRWIEPAYWITYMY